MKLLSVILLMSGLALVLPASAVRADKPAEQGFRTLFDGKSLDGWEGDPNIWSVADGAITGTTTKENPIKKNTFLFWRGGTVADFELRVRFRIASGNSGVQYRSKDRGDFVCNGYQADFDAGHNYTGMLYEEGGRGIVARPGQKIRITQDGKKEKLGTTGDLKQLATQLADGDWHELTIIARGNRLVHRVNGIVTAEITDEQPDKRADSGLLAFQVHRGPPMVVQFKDIRLKEFPQEKK